MWLPRVSEAEVLTAVMQLQENGTSAPILFRMLLDQNQNTLTELEMAGRYVQSMNDTSVLCASAALICSTGGEAFLSLESFPCLRKLSLILRTYVSPKDDPEIWKDLRGAVTLLSSRPSTTTLNDLRFICDPLLQPHIIKPMLGENTLVHDLEAILLAEPYTTTVRVAFEVLEPIKENEARYAREAIKIAFPALQEKGFLHVVFRRACKLVLLFHTHHKPRKTDRSALAQLDLVTTGRSSLWQCPPMMTGS